MINYVLNPSNIHGAEIWQGKSAKFFKLFDLGLEPKYSTVKFLCTDLSVLVFQDAPVYPFMHILKVVRIIQELVQYIVRDRAIQSDVRNLQDLLCLVHENNIGRLVVATHGAADHYLLGHLVEDVLGQFLAVSYQIIEETATESSEYGVRRKVEEQEDLKQAIDSHCSLKELNPSLLLELPTEDVEC